MVYHNYGSPDVFQEKPDRTDQMRCRVGQASELALFFRENLGHPGCKIHIMLLL